MLTKKHENLIRYLNKTEEAYTLINDYYPFTATCVLKLKNAVNKNALRNALDRLQLSHPLLRAVIKEKNGKFWFEKSTEAKPVSLDFIERKDKDHWYGVVRRELNGGISTKANPLMKVTCLFPSELSGPAEIIFSFHHSIIDAGSFMALVDQFLTLAGEVHSNKQILSELPESPMSPDMDKVLPSPFKGFRYFFRLIPFMLKQIIDELKYKKANGKVIDSAIPSSSDNDILTVNFAKEETDAIVRWSRNKRVSLNSVLTAAMLMIVNQFNYHGQKKRMRTIQFGNLRPYLNPSVPANSGGCFVSMMRFTIPVNTTAGLDQMAEYIDQQTLKASRRGDKFMFALLGKMLVKQTIKAHNKRLAASALSYVGPVRLQEQYGDIRLLDIHGFITNNGLGAEFTGLGKICFSRLSLDLNFLTEEISSEKAYKMANELKSFLLISTKGK